MHSLVRTVVDMVALAEESTRAATLVTLLTKNKNPTMRAMVDLVGPAFQATLETLVLRVILVVKETQVPTVTQASVRTVVQPVTRGRAVTQAEMVTPATQALLVTQVLARRTETQVEEVPLVTQEVTATQATLVLLVTLDLALDQETLEALLRTHGLVSLALVETLVTQVDLVTQARELDLVTQVVPLLHRGLVSLDQQATLAILARRVMLVLSEPLAMQV